MDSGIVSGIVTAVLLVLFIGAWIWAWSSRRKADFEAASRLPLDDDNPPPARDRANTDRREPKA